MNIFHQRTNTEKYSAEVLLKLAIHVCLTSNQELVHATKNIK